MNSRNILLTGAVLAGLGVALGAFGAHGLKPILLANNRLDVYETAVRYQVIHSLALLFCGLYMNQMNATVLLRRAAMCWLAGVLLFSGSLYGLSLTASTALGFLTPFGGLLFLCGWLLLIIAILKNKKGPEGP